MSREPNENPAGFRDGCLIDDSAEREQLLELAQTSDRRLALLMDPGLAVSTDEHSAFTDLEVDEIKRSVLQARRMRDVERLSEQRRPNRLSALAVAMTLFLLLLLPTGLKRSVEQPTPRTVRSSPAGMTHVSVEALDLPGARVYQLADDEFSLVLVVDESFEL